MRPSVNLDRSLTFFLSPRRTFHTISFTAQPYSKKLAASSMKSSHVCSMSCIHDFRNLPASLRSSSSLSPSTTAQSAPRIIMRNTKSIAPTVGSLSAISR